MRSGHPTEEHTVVGAAGTKALKQEQRNGKVRAAQWEGTEMDRQGPNQ